MNAREVIEGQIGKWPTTYTLDALKQAGFVVMKKEDVEAVRDTAIEDAARHLEDWGDMYGDNAARSIRSLKSGGRDAD